MTKNPPHSGSPPGEWREALNTALGDAEELEAFKQWAQCVPKDKQLAALASLTGMRKFFEDEAYEKGLLKGISLAKADVTVNVVQGDLVTTNSNNKNATIASGTSSTASSNAGNQHGVSVGSGEAHGEAAKQGSSGTLQIVVAMISALAVVVAALIAVYTPTCAVSERATKVKAE